MLTVRQIGKSLFDVVLTSCVCVVLTSPVTSQCRFMSLVVD